MVCSLRVPNVKTNTRLPASPGKKWGERTAPVGPSEVDSGASPEISSSGSPPRAGTWYNTSGGPLLNTITSPSGLQEPPVKSPGNSQSRTDSPPYTDTFLSSLPAENPMKSLPGDQKGDHAPSVPSISRGCG